tara:strand:+ start:214 stop:402 length:189 start_codon:yes stop_codon:yes gene_type:complete
MKNETGIAEKEIVTPDGVIHKTQRVNILDQSNGVYVVEVQETKQIIKNIPTHCIRKLDPKIT